MRGRCSASKCGDKAGYLHRCVHFSGLELESRSDILSNRGDDRTMLTEEDGVRKVGLEKVRQLKLYVPNGDTVPLRLALLKGPRHASTQPKHRSRLRRS